MIRASLRVNTPTPRPSQGEPGPETHDPNAHIPEWQPSERDIADSVRMLGYGMMDTTRYGPDVPALTARPGQVVLGVGADSGHLLTQRTTAALADLLGTEVVTFPGDHGGSLPDPVAFAQVLTTVLAPVRVRIGGGSAGGRGPAGEALRRAPAGCSPPDWPR